MMKCKPPKIISLNVILLNFCLTLGLRKIGTFESITKNPARSFHLHLSTEIVWTWQSI